MQRRAGLLVIVLLALLAVGCDEQAQGQDDAAEPGGPIRHVILVSVDGLVPATYLDPDRYGLKVPLLREMVAAGVHSPGARSVLPSVTYPAHTSIATGVNPGRHGIVTNAAWDPLGENDGGWRWYAEDIRVPTLWQAARERGLRTGLVWWPVSVGAEATALVPEVWRAHTEEDVKLVRALSTPGLLDAVEEKFPGSLEGFRPPNPATESLTDIAVHILETVRPHLVLLHLAQVDHWQHEDGPLGRRAHPAIELLDAQLARLVEAAKAAGIWEHTALVVVSDHGFAETCRRVRPGVWLAERGLVTLDERDRMQDWKAVVAPASGMAYLYLKDKADAETRQALLDIFQPRAGRHGSGIARVLTPEDIRILGGDPEAALAIEAERGFAMSGGYAGEAISDAPLGGTHGYPPDNPEMLASLLIYGSAVGLGRLEGVRLIDVAPTVAGWLELELGPVEGLALAVPLRAPQR